MDKLCPTGQYFVDFLKKNLPKQYFLFGSVRSFQVSPSVVGQLRDDLLRYNTITTIPLAGTKEIGEDIDWKQPFVYRPTKLEQFDWIDDGWKSVAKVGERDYVSPELEFGIRKKARLVEIDGLMFNKLFRTGLLLGTKLGRESYDIELLRVDIPKEKLLGILRDEMKGIKNVENRIRDRVRLTFDCNYVHSLPEWTLKKPRILPK